MGGVYQDGGYQAARAVVEPAGERIEKDLRGEPGIGLLSLTDAWLDYMESEVFRGGCFFVATAAELGGRPGPVPAPRALPGHVLDGEGEKGAPEEGARGGVGEDEQGEEDQEQAEQGEDEETSRDERPIAAAATWTRPPAPMPSVETRPAVRPWSML